MKDQFIDFHSSVSVISQHFGWVLAKLDSDSVGVSVLEKLHDDLELLLASKSPFSDQKPAST